MAGMTDTLVGLKENVILGHLIPAGTGYQPHQNLKIKYLVERNETPVPDRLAELQAARANLEATGVPQGAGA